MLNAQCCPYRFAAPRTIFFTLRFFEPRAYSRGFSGFSVLTFLRDVRFAFLRSSLLRLFVFGMNVVGSFNEIKANLTLADDSCPLRSC